MEITGALDTLATVLLAGLAGYQLADTWTVGSIFKRPQKWLRKRRAKSKLAELASCPFCLSHWLVGAALLLMLATSWDSPARIPVYWLAAVKVAVLVMREEEILVDETQEVDDIEVMDDLLEDDMARYADDDSSSGEHQS